MSVRLRVIAVGVAVVAGVLLLPAVAGAVWIGFKTPGDAAYCQWKGSSAASAHFICVRPKDGFWVRMSGIQRKDRRVEVTAGFADRYEGFRSREAQVLRFGRKWFSSDAEVITCTSRRSGLTCRHYGGRGFRLGRTGFEVF